MNKLSKYIAIPLCASAFVTSTASAETIDGSHLLGTLLGATGGAWAGSNIGKGKGNIAAIAVGTLVGAGIGGGIGKHYSNHPPRRAYRARHHYARYTYQPPRARWVAPVATVQEVSYTNSAPEEYCREYIERVTIAGKEQESFGTACYRPDGSWEVK